MADGARSREPGVPRVPGRGAATESPIAGSALLAGPQTVLTAGQAYGWVDPDGTASSAYTVEDLDLNGTRTMYGPFFAGAPPMPGRLVRRGEGRRPAQRTRWVRAGAG